MNSFKISQLVYDLTVRFCGLYIDRKSLIHDQMVQAARSGVQNIAESNQASVTSKEMVFKLTKAARASLMGLRSDYEEFLRYRGLRVWERWDPRREELIGRRLKTADEVEGWVKEFYDQEQGKLRSAPEISTPSSGFTPSTHLEITANAVLTYIVVVCSLLEHQIAKQARYL